MKLIFCPACGDITKLSFTFRTCQCGKSWGKCLDLHDVEVGGRTVVVGLDNNSLLRGLREQPETGRGPAVEAFIFPKKHTKIHSARRLKK